VKIGIPRALSYFEYYPLWYTFFRNLDCEVVLSPPTNRWIIDEGMRLSVEGTCLPVKTFFGHLAALQGLDTDYLFVPRLVGIRRGEYICPKFMGLPDMVKNCFNLEMSMLCPCINLAEGGEDFRRALVRVGCQLGFGRRRAKQAYIEAEAAQAGFDAIVAAGVFPGRVLGAFEREPDKLLNDGFEEITGRLQSAESPSALKEPELTLGMLGHPYLMYDRQLNMDIYHQLQTRGVQVVTVDNVTRRDGSDGKPGERFYWTSTRRAVIAVRDFIKTGLQGIIHLVAFGCGADSITTELVTRQALHGQEIPYLVINLDEHSGQAGVITRLEAFLDMIKRRGIGVENHVSTHG